MADTLLVIKCSVCSQEMTFTPNLLKLHFNCACGESTYTFSYFEGVARLTCYDELRKFPETVKEPI